MSGYVFRYSWRILAESWNYLQTVETLNRRCILRRLIWVCTVCQLPFGWSPDYFRVSQLIVWKTVVLVLLVLCGITKTCLYNFDPLKSHFYIVKLGFTGGRHYFAYFAKKNIDCGYSLEPSRRGGSNEYNSLCFEQKYEKCQSFYLNIFSFWWWNFLYIWIGVFS